MRILKLFMIAPVVLFTACGGGNENVEPATPAPAMSSTTDMTDAAPPMPEPAAVIDAAVAAPVVVDAAPPEPVAAPVVDAGAPMDAGSATAEDAGKKAAPKKDATKGTTTPKKK